AGPRRATHSADGASAVNTTVAPRGNSETVFFLLESRADVTPNRAARSNNVGARSNVALSMYSSRWARASQYELPVMPWTAGHVPQQMEALFALVTGGITPRTALKTPRSFHRASVGIALAAR